MSGKCRILVASATLVGVIAASAALAYAWEPVNFGWADVRSGQSDQNYGGSPQPGTIQIWANGSSVGAQADYFSWDSDAVRSDVDPKLDWTHDEGQADYANYGTDVPNDGIYAADDNGSPNTREEVELGIAEASIEVGRTYRYYRVDWSGSQGGGKMNLSYEWGQWWDRDHDWLEGMNYPTPMAQPLSVTGVASSAHSTSVNAGTTNDKVDIIEDKIEAKILQGQATLRGVKRPGGTALGHITWNTGSADARAAHAKASRDLASQMLGSGVKPVPVTVTFSRSVSAEDVIAISKRTGLRIQHVYAGGLDPSGTRFSAGTLADAQGSFDTAVLHRVLADGGARYAGITSVVGEISTDSSALGSLLVEPQVSDVDASAVEAQQILVRAFRLPSESVKITVPSPHWYVPVD